MKRDMDLIRKIMLQAEASPTGFVADGEIDLTGYSEDEVAYHIWLMVDAGLANGQDITCEDSSGPQAFFSNLTWQGHEFLDTIRSQTVWDKVKAKASVVGGASLPVIIELASSLVKEQLGLK